MRLHPAALLASGVVLFALGFWVGSYWGRSKASHTTSVASTPLEASTPAAEVTATPAATATTDPSATPAAGGTTDPGAVQADIWLDTEHRAVVIACGGHRVEAASGSNHNETRRDRRRPTRALVEFLSWSKASKLLREGNAQLVCRMQEQDGGSWTEVSRSFRDDNGSIKMVVNAVVPGALYALEFQKNKDADRQQMATFRVKALVPEDGTGDATDEG